MNKTAIRNFAIWARNKLIADVSYKAGLMGITSEGISDALSQSTLDVEFYDIGTAEPYAIRGEEIKQRKGLVDIIRQKEKESDYATAYSSVIEEVAYTWFNRLIAVRFMEVNDYMPAHIRVLSSETGKLEPDIVTTPFDAELELSDVEKQQIIELKNDNKLDECFRLLFIKQCNVLHSMLPRLFENTSDYSELLLNVSFVDQDGVIYHLVHDIEEDDFNIEKGGQVEIIGWLYQYYNSELKDETFALLKNKIKVTKERIPSATQLFTPDWIVRYMVENSLGRLWIEGHPNDSLKTGWKYYLDEVEQEADVQAQLDEIRKEYAKLSPEDIKVIDPCMGSGHILVYAFDVLMQIYESAGYTQRDAAKSILENNLFGLDIDERAAQLAYFAVLMKARQYNRRILNDGAICNVYAIRESNGIDMAALESLGESGAIGERLIKAFVDAKEYGSILTLDITDAELDELERKVSEIKEKNSYENMFDALNSEAIINDVTPLILQARNMIQKYDAVITNPPYMGNMSEKLVEYSKEHYLKYRYDFYAIFIKKAAMMKNAFGFSALVTGDSWLSLSSYISMRKEILSTESFESILPLGADAFEAGFGTVAFVFRDKIEKYKTTYVDLSDISSKSDCITEKDYNDKLFIHDNEIFLDTEGSEFTYPCSDKDLKIMKGETLSDELIPKAGLVAGNNDLYLKLWYEVNDFDFNRTAECVEQITHKDWIPLHKGGGYRKWYGVHEYVISLKKMISDRTKNKAIRTGDPDYFFKEGITWSTLSNKFGLRKSPKGFAYNTKGSMCFAKHGNIDYYLGLMNSVVASYFIKIIAPNLDFNSGTVIKIPCKLDKEEEVEQITEMNVSLSKEDWDSFETSWDFKKHPLI